MIQFANFQLYTFSNTSESSFDVLYIALIAIFAGLLVAHFALSGKIFKEGLKTQLNEGTQLLVRLLSFVMIIFLSLFQYPFLCTMMQGFFC